jgi:hypothetical protein
MKAGHREPGRYDDCAKEIQDGDTKTRELVGGDGA